MLQILDLPDVILFEIVSYVAPPLHRSYVICHQLAPLCKQCYNRFILINTQHSLTERSQTKNNVDNNGRYCTNNITSIWDSVLQHDYNTITLAGNNHTDQTQCASKRLQHLTSFDIVKSIHDNVNEMTETVFFWLNTLTSCSTDCPTDYGNRLSLERMQRIFDEYGPNLLINKIVSNGSTFLVDVCRSRNVSEYTILNCIKELLKNWNANINKQTNESTTSKQTVLCVAAARGMSTIVHYLLIHQPQHQEKSSTFTYVVHNDVVDTQIRCSGRFNMHFSSNRPDKPKKKVNNMY